MPTGPARAQFGNAVADDLQEVTDDLRALTHGRWAVAVGFEGQTVLARFGRWGAAKNPGQQWRGVQGPWTSSLNQPEYEAAVRAIKDDIARGWVYQVNLCRVLSAPCGASSLAGLHDRLNTFRPQFGGLLELPDHDVHIACASPERFLSRSGDLVRSSPIKGTSASPDGFLPKDRAENVMIVDLVRNDLGVVAAPGSVVVDTLMEVEPYPGLFHLVSTVSASTQVSWADLLAATLPPGSVSGAPKHSALEVISRLEPVPRDWYCGAFGWIDVDRQQAELAVAIRTFWLSDGILHFGTGAGITWGSDPAGEWQETELKASKLVALASS